MTIIKLWLNITICTRNQTFIQEIPYKLPSVIHDTFTCLNKSREGFKTLESMIIEKFYLIGFCYFTIHNPTIDDPATHD